MNDVINKLMSCLKVHPVLIDIGASGAYPKIWEHIAQYSIYMGFDPDIREIQEIPKWHFYKSIIVNEAITSDKESNEALFYLTRSPYCSSTLKPDSASLSNFLFSDLFLVEKEIKVRAATLDSVIERFSLPGIDWLKVDSQGTDLRIFKSLKDDIRSHVMAVDIEPGLIDAYLGEDLFIHAHNYLTQNGFWLSTLKVCGSVRMKRSTMDKINIFGNKETDFALINSTVKNTPCWCEARYFRTLDSISRGKTERDYFLLWVFSFLDNQFGFAIDLAFEYEKIFGGGDVSKMMKNAAISCIKQSCSKKRLVRAKLAEFLPVKVKQWLKKVYSA